MQAAALAGEAALLPSASAHAEGTAKPEGTLTDPGPASVTTPLGNGEFRRLGC